MERMEEANITNFFSFLKGIASAFNITGRTFAFPDFSGGFERDKEALAGDWNRVGSDLRSAMSQTIHDR